MDICWTTIYVNDMAESLKFYTEIMGLSISRQFKSKPNVEISFLKAGGIEYELIFDPQKTPIAHGDNVSVGFKVPSLAKKIEELKAKGITQIIGPINPNPNVSFIFIKDPNGFTLQIVEQKD